MAALYGNQGEKHDRRFLLALDAGEALDRQRVSRQWRARSPTDVRRHRRLWIPEPPFGRRCRGNNRGDS